MPGDSGYQQFIQSVYQKLLKNGWEISEQFTDLGDVAFYRIDSAALVATHRFIVVRQGEGLSKSKVGSLVTEAHQRLNGTPPLFPATCTLIFVFAGSTPMDWVVQRTRTGNLFSSTFAVAWAVVLPEKKLFTHKGTPMFTSGASAVRSALAALKTTPR